MLEQPKAESSLDCKPGVNNNRLDRSGQNEPLKLKSFIWVILGIIMMAQIIGTFSTEGIIAPLAPFLQKALALNRAQIGSLMSASFLGMGLFSIVAGMLIDKYGIKSVLSIGLMVMAAGAFLFSVTAGYIPSWLFALVGGFGYSIIQPSTVKGIVIWFPEKIHATMLSIKQSGVSFGAGFAAMLLVPIARFSGWRTAMVFAGVLALITAGLVAFFYRNPPQLKPTPKAVQKENIGFFQIMKVKEFRIMAFMALLRNAIHYSTISYLVIYLVEKKYNIVFAAMFLVVLQISSAISNIFWGLLNDFFGSRKLKMILNMIGIICILGFTVFMVLPVSIHAVLWCGAIFVGMGGAGASGVYSYVMTSTCKRMNFGVGTVTGVNSLMSCVGTIFAPPVFGWLVDTSGNYQLGWGLLTFFAGLLFVLALELNKSLFKEANP